MKIRGSRTNRLTKPFPRRVEPARQLGSVAVRHRLPTALDNRSPMVSRRRFSQRQLGSTDPTKRDPGLARLEAVLFLAKEPLNSRKLSHYANLADGTEARTLIGRLNQLYERAGRAFRVEELAGGMQLLTRPKFAAWLRRLQHVPPEIRLSAPAMETLAVVAYRQPVLRSEIEGIRGVACGELLRQLMDRELVRVAGRSDELGRPYLYGTTRRFLQMFGFRDLEDLPRAEVFRLAEDALASADGRSRVSGGISDGQEFAETSGQQRERDSQVSIMTEMDLRSPGVAGPESVEPLADGQDAATPTVSEDESNEDWEDEDEDFEYDDEDDEDEEDKDADVEVDPKDDEELDDDDDDPKDDEELDDDDDDGEEWDDDDDDDDFDDDDDDDDDEDPDADEELDDNKWEEVKEDDIDEGESDDDESDDDESDDDDLDDDDLDDDELDDDYEDDDDEPEWEEEK